MHYLILFTLTDEEKSALADFSSSDIETFMYYNTEYSM